MFKSLLTSVLTLLTIAAAQTPQGFNVTSTTSLTVVIQPSNVSVTASLLVSPAQTRNTPWIYIPSGASTDSTYLVIMIDSALPLLHWMQPNLVADSSRNLSFNAVVRDASTAIGAPYIAPQPPTGQVHDYVWLLYKQPDNWAVPTNYSTINPPGSAQARMGFQISDFQSAAGLSSPIAANYIRALNGTATQSSSLLSSISTALTTASGPATASATTRSGSASGSSTASATTSANLGSSTTLQGAYGLAGLLAVVGEVLLTLL